MKRIMLAFLLCSFGMAIFAQGVDMSYYTEEYNRDSATFVDRLEILETVRDANMTGIGDFYYDALTVLLARTPDIRTKEDRDANDASARIICQGLAAENYTEASAALWQAVQYFDVINAYNEGLPMQDALIAIGAAGATEYVPHIVLRLTDFNEQVLSDVESKRRVQRAVVGCISALEALHEIAGYRPVFFASIGWYDPAIKTIASVALPNIVNDPSDVIIEIIQDPSANPFTKYEVWREMLRTNAPNDSKAKVAAVALNTGWIYSTSTPAYQRNLREMRKGAIYIIGQMGASDDSVYPNLRRSYNDNYTSANMDIDEIRNTIACLSALKTDPAVNLLLEFLRELDSRKRANVWGNKEREMLQLIIPALGNTQTSSPEVRQLLTTIQRSSNYTGNEQLWARNALRQLGQ